MGFAIACTNISTFCLYGLNSAIGILSPIYFGQKDLVNCERVLHLGRILCLLGTFPLAVLNSFLHPFLISLGVEEEVADYARIYGAFLFVAVSCHYQFDCYRLYLNSVGETKVLSFVCLFTSIIHIFACYILTIELNFGVLGVAISTVMTLFNNCLLVTLYSWRILEYHVSPCPPSIR